MQFYVVETVIKCECHRGALPFGTNSKCEIILGTYIYGGNTSYPSFLKHRARHTVIYKLVRNNSVSCLPQGRKYCIWLWAVCPLQVHWGHGLISKETPTTMTTSSLKRWRQKWRNRTWGWNRCRLYSAMEPERPYISSPMSRRSVFLAYAMLYC